VLLDDQINGIIKARAAAGACATDRLLDHVSISGRFALHLDAIVKRHHHHAVCRFQSFDKLDCRVLNVAETEVC
jgi:hypothetical protein